MLDHKNPFMVRYHLVSFISLVVVTDFPQKNEVIIYTVSRISKEICPS